MTQFQHKLQGYVANKIEGSDAPATSFEDIGKSRFMQLSAVKNIQHFLLFLRKKAKENFYYLKSSVDE